MTGDSRINMTNSRIVNVKDPQNPQDVATKSYVDDTSGGIADVSCSDGEAIVGVQNGNPQCGPVSGGGSHKKPNPFNFTFEKKPCSKLITESNPQNIAGIASMQAQTSISGINKPVTAEITSLDTDVPSTLSWAISDFRSYPATSTWVSTTFKIINLHPERSKENVLSGDTVRVTVTVSNKESTSITLKVGERTASYTVPSCDLPSIDEIPNNVYLGDWY